MLLIRKAVSCMSCVLQGRLYWKPYWKLYKVTWYSRSNGILQGFSENRVTCKRNRSIFCQVTGISLFVDATNKGLGQSECSLLVVNDFWKRIVTILIYTDNRCSFDGSFLLIVIFFILLHSHLCILYVISERETVCPNYIINFFLFR